MFHAPGVQVVARVPVAGPVPPPSIVVPPDAIATSIMEEFEDEAKWDTAFASSQSLLADLAAEAIAKFHDGQTQVLDSETL